MQQPRLSPNYAGRPMRQFKCTLSCFKWRAGSHPVRFFFSEGEPACRPEDPLNRLNQFKTADFDWYSDHSYISADLSVDISKAHDVPFAWSKIVRQFQNWDLQCKHKFVDELISHNISARLETFCNTSFEDSTQCANSFTDIITDVLVKVFLRKRKIIKPLRKPAFY